MSRREMPGSLDLWNKQFGLMQYNKKRKREEPAAEDRPKLLSTREKLMILERDLAARFRFVS